MVRFVEFVPMNNKIKSKKLMKHIILSKQFNLEQYLVKLEDTITKIIKRVSKTTLTYDIMDTKKLQKNKLIALKEKQRQMKIGEIIQAMLGQYDKFINLGNNHETGLDIISDERKIIIELKNRTNTDNASAKKSNLDKLAKFKIANPEFTCIYGCINDDTEEKTTEGKIEIISHQNVELKYYVGMKLLELVLGEHTNTIIKFVKKLINKLT